MLKEEKGCLALLCLFKWLTPTLLGCSKLDHLKIDRWIYLI
ncbi:hypothetical protein OIU74_020185 [Salix koriyanagi]|uniref:Uncharacterized protein n=1 Tax=Salix koriyanagi TaxID=2511006 RepID=A0A9Q0SLW3_9ROSI|nr:hypothetical protein OIU74_020185 [Salix koriyanagi]